MTNVDLCSTSEYSTKQMNNGVKSSCIHAACLLYTSDAADEEDEEDEASKDFVLGPIE